MAETLQELKAVASELPDADRIELTQFLLSSLDSNERNAVRKEWLAVARSRLDELRSGAVVGIPAADVLNSLIERHT